MSKKSKRVKHKNAASQDQDMVHEDKNINRSIHVRGEIEVGRSPSLQDQHDTERKEDATQQERIYRLERLGLIVVAVYTLVTFWQSISAQRGATAAKAAAASAQGSLELARQATHLEQRAWVSVAMPNTFAPFGGSIPATIQIQNTGRTPARNIQEDVIATVLNKGEAIDVGNFAVGHPHNRVYFGALFPNMALPLSIPISRYGPHGAEVVIPDNALRRDIATGNRFIVFFGQIAYDDIFGIQHWTRFCAGTSGAPVKECVQYNDADSNQ